MIDERLGEYKETFTGKKFYVLDVRPEDICIADIAHSLSLQCRYNGHCTQHYSVAEHSILVALHALNEGHTYLSVMRALMHDAVEAFIGDIPKPVKLSIPALMEAEDRIETTIMDKYELPRGKADWLGDYDWRITIDERAAIMPPSDNIWGHEHLKPLGVKINCIEPEQVEYEFLLWFEYLRRQLGVTDEQARNY